MSATVHHAVLENGMHVIAELTDSVHSIAAGFFVRAGSRDEDPALAGVSHFLEHMAFKGGAKRDALRINQDFDRVGAKHNASTSEEETIYYAACLPEYLPQTFDVLAELPRPRIDEADFQTEKDVIIEEIRMYLDDPTSVAFETAQQAHFGGHPLGQSILGSVDSITDLRVDQMRSYHLGRYGPSNIVLAFSGKSRWESLLDLARTHCESWSGTAAPRVANPGRGTRAFRPVSRPDDQQELLVGVSDAPALESADRYAAGLLATMLGDHSGSRLYWELVDPGLADSANLSYKSFNRAGSMFTFVSCSPEHAQDNLNRVAGVYARAFAYGFSEDELTQAKNKLLARNVLRGERPMGRLMPLGYYWLYFQKYVSVQDEMDAFARVTLQDIRRLLDEWPFLPMTITTVGPRTDLDPPA